ALSSIWACSRPEELPFQIFHSPLERVDDTRDPGGDDLDASIPSDTELVPRLYRGLHRRAVRGDGEDDPVLLVDNRADPELPIGHGLDHGFELIVPAEVGLRLGSDT